MEGGQSQHPEMTWLAFAMLTVVTWGVYGVLLHRGQTLMADPANGRYKAFLFVGVAYFLTAVLAPLVVLILNKASWQFSPEGMKWSLIAGIMGAIGAFGTLLAFGAKGSPAVVMSIVFAGAPIVNAIFAMAISPPQGGLTAIRWPFALGLILAAIGGCLVTLFRPLPRQAHASPAPVAAPVGEPRG